MKTKIIHQGLIFVLIKTNTNKETEFFKLAFPYKFDPMQACPLKKWNMDVAHAPALVCVCVRVCVWGGGLIYTYISLSICLLSDTTHANILLSKINLRTRLGKG